MERYLQFIPQSFVQSMLLQHGESVAAWLERLPGAIVASQRRWRLTLSPPLGDLSWAYVAPAIRPDGTRVVLKIVPDPAAALREMQALRAFDGCSAVRLLDIDAEHGTLLLERIKPGTTLASIDDDERAMRVAVDVLRRLHRQPSGGLTGRFPSVEDWVADFHALRARPGVSAVIPRHLLDAATHLFSELVPSQVDRVLLHGDLHHANILASDRDGWLAIDPKGVIGEPAYEVGALLRNPASTLERPDPKAILARRIEILAEGLDVDAARVHGWALAQGVLAAAWGIDDTGHVWQQGIAFAELLATIG